MSARVAMEPIWLVVICGWTVGVLEATPRGNRHVIDQFVEVDSEAGRLRGKREHVRGRDLDIFLGIPFARPPVGSLRYQRPQRIAPWKGVRDATKRPASCYQALDNAFGKFEGVNMWNANTNMSEDCLYLNIWAPADRTYGGDPGRAVMVWIYGGGFYGGTSTLDLYDGRILAAENDIVVVSMQYRVGSLGFLYLGTGGAPGNMGLVDQHVALRWIFNNIDVFGGNKHSITLFGESAGAVSVSLHLLSPLSKPLFQHAIMQSGGPTCQWASESNALARRRSLRLAKKVGCLNDDMSIAEVLGCLREVDPMQITNTMWTLTDSHNLVTPILFTVDGYFLREDPNLSVAKGNYKRANILLGAMKDEGSYFLVYSIPRLYSLLPNTSLSYTEYRGIVESLSRSGHPALTEAIDFEYNVPSNIHTHRMYRDVMDDMLGDSEFICPVIKFGQASRKHGAKVYMYQFTHRTSGNPWPAWMGVMHGYEIDHVFGVPLNDTYNYSNAEKQLSTRIMAYWSNFARTGDPNRRSLRDNGVNRGFIHWPEFSTTNEEYLIIDDDVTGSPVGSGLRYRKCQFWDRLVPMLQRAVEALPIKTGCVSGSSVFKPLTPLFVSAFLLQLQSILRLGHL